MYIYNIYIYIYIYTYIPDVIFLMCSFLPLSNFFFNTYLVSTFEQLNSVSFNIIYTMMIHIFV